MRGRRCWDRRDREPTAFSVVLVLRNGMGSIAGLAIGRAFTRYLV